MQKAGIVMDTPGMRELQIIKKLLPGANWATAQEAVGTIGDTIPLIPLA